MGCSCRLFLLCLLCFAFVPLGPPLAIWASNHFNCRTRAWVVLVLVVLGVGLGTTFMGLFNWSISLRSGFSFGILYFAAFLENNGPGCGGGGRYNSTGKAPVGRRPRRRAVVASSASDEEGNSSSAELADTANQDSADEEIARRRGLAASKTRRDAQSGGVP
ncbi:hypothetical protein JCM6882_005589 [Rhodosporidiobolus microsporus]